MIADSKARPILMWRYKVEQVPAATARLGIAVVGTIAECLELLTDFPGSTPARGDRQHDSSSSPAVSPAGNR